MENMIGAGPHRSACTNAKGVVTLLLETGNGNCYILLARQCLQWSLLDCDCKKLHWEKDGKNMVRTLALGWPNLECHRCPLCGEIECATQALLLTSELDSNEEWIG